MFTRSYRLVFGLLVWSLVLRFSPAAVAAGLPEAGPIASRTRSADLNREMILVPPEGTTAEDAEIAAWQKRAGAPGAREADCDRLGWAFIAKARRTLDVGYYKFAEKTADVMDAQFGATPAAALLRGHVFHNLHRFAEAEAIARQLAATRGMPEDWALLSDALMEQGEIRAAIDALQRFANLKPGAEADTRISHIRWLKGDLRGAITAMEAAVRETSPRDDEHLAWMLSRLAGFWLQVGEVEHARSVADGALRHAPDFPPALLALGRTQLAEHDLKGAVVSLESAVKRNPLPEYLWWLAEAHRADGSNDRAEALEHEIVERGERDDPRTLALWLATRRERVTLAVQLARAETKTRRDPLTHDALAWALLAAGAAADAADEIRIALVEGTQDPRLLLHAAVILRTAGKAADATRFATECKRGASALLPSERTMLDREIAALDESPAVSPSQPLRGYAARGGPARARAAVAAEYVFSPE